MDNLQGDPKQVEERWTDVDYDGQSNCSNGEVTSEGGADDGLEPHGLRGAQPAKDEPPTDSACVIAETEATIPERSNTGLDEPAEDADGLDCNGMGISVEEEHMGDDTREAGDEVGDQSAMIVSHLHDKGDDGDGSQEDGGDDQHRVGSQLGSAQQGDDEPTEPVSENRLMEFQEKGKELLPSLSGTGDWQADHASAVRDDETDRGIVYHAHHPSVEIGERAPGGDYGSVLSRRGDGSRVRRREVGDGYVSPSLVAPSEALLRNLHFPIAGRDKESQVVIEALQEVYRTKLKPIEEISMFDKFHYDTIADSELQAKPQVLVLGAYSTGKTSLIRHLIGRDFPAMDISPEPSTETFRAVMAGAEERTINGAAVCIVDELPFSGLGKFGVPFLSKFQVCTAPAPLLEHLTFVDTPGVLSGETHVSRRGYPFAKVVRWFADRSDLILLMFDAHKLDLGEEFRDVINAIAHHGNKVRVVLNKAQQVDSDRLIKVYGALMWSIGRCLKDKSDAPKVYVGSFWDGPRRRPEDGDEQVGGDVVFEDDESLLRREIMDLPKNIGARKINDLMQRAKLVKVHLQIMYAISARMPRWWGAEAAQERIMGELDEIFEEVRAEAKVSAAEMPDLEEYRRDLLDIDFRRLPRKRRRLLANIDAIINRDIKECFTRAGGMRRIYKLDTAAKIGNLMPTSLTSARLRSNAEGFSSLEISGSIGRRGYYAGRNGVGKSNLDRPPRRRPRRPPITDEWSDEGASLEDEDDDRLGVDSRLLGPGLDRLQESKARDGDQEVPFLMATVGIVCFVLSLGTLLLYRYPVDEVREFLSFVLPNN